MVNTITNTGYVTNAHTIHLDWQNMLEINDMLLSMWQTVNMESRLITLSEVYYFNTVCTNCQYKTTDHMQRRL